MGQELGAMSQEPPSRLGEERGGVFPTPIAKFPYPDSQSGRRNPLYKFDRLIGVYFHFRSDPREDLGPLTRVWLLSSNDKPISGDRLANPERQRENLTEYRTGQLN